MKLVSQKIRDSARGEACALRLVGVCNFDPATTVFAHLPVHHRGMSIKSPDLFGVYACACCHDAIDGRVAGPWSFSDLLRALAETQMKLVEKGLLTVAGDGARRPAARPSKILPRRA